MRVVQPIRDLEKIKEIKEHLKQSNLRNYMMFVLGVNTGLRISDILPLTVGHVRDRDYISIIEKKTKKQKLMLITDTLKKDIALYLESKNDGEYLIKSREGINKPITRKRAYQILKQIEGQVGLSELGTHTLRKTFGYHFYKRYKDLATLMDILNHSTERMTLRYIGVNQDAKDKKMKEFGI